MLNAFNLISTWSIVLMVLDYKQFASATYIRSASVVLAPYLGILLVWLLVILI